MHIKYTFFVEASLSEVLLALLQELPFQAFEEIEGGLVTAIDEQLVNEAFEMQLKSFQQFLEFDFVKEKLAEENWNAIWESTFREILIDRFCQIRAPFHPIREDVEHTIMIEPRMAFGTGHHETTRLMIHAMRTLNFEGLSVADFGAGTGILAILAHQLGANAVFAIECDPVAFDNLVENTQLNLAPEIQCRLDDNLTAFDNDSIDLLLVNITRNTILQNLASFVRVLRIGGYLLLSGFLDRDVEQILEEASTLSLHKDEHHTENEWASLILKLA